MAENLVNTLSRKNWIKAKNIEKTRGFYKRHGAKTLIIARFLPIVRTFAPFVAGVGKMYYPKYLFVSIVSAIIWVVTVTVCGYFLGNIPIIRDYFSIVVFVIIILSIIPGLVIAFLGAKKAKNIACIFFNVFIVNICHVLCYY